MYYQFTHIFQGDLYVMGAETWYELTGHTAQPINTIEAAKNLAGICRLYPDWTDINVYRVWDMKMKDVTDAIATLAAEKFIERPESDWLAKYWEKIQ